MWVAVVFASNRICFRRGNPPWAVLLITMSTRPTAPVVSAEMRCRFEPLHVLQVPALLQAAVGGHLQSIGRSQTNRSCPLLLNANTRTGHYCLAWKPFFERVTLLPGKLATKQRKSRFRLHNGLFKSKKLTGFLLLRIDAYQAYYTCLSGKNVGIV